MLGLRERKKARTKAAIQEHALRLFAEQGYAETTVEQIAEAAEVSPSTFFRYFPTKDETVLTDLLDAQTIQLMLEAPIEMSPIEALTYAVHQTFQQMSDERLQLEMTRSRLIRSVPELRRGILAELTRPMELFADGIATRLGRSVDTDIRLYAGAVIGALMTVTTGGFEDDPRGTLNTLTELLGRLELVVRLPEP